MNLGLTNADGIIGGGEIGAMSLSIGLFDGLNEYVKMLVGLDC